MFCGFGAVILLVMILDHGMVKNRDEVRRDLSGEVNRLETTLLDESRQLAVLRNTLEQSDRERVEAEGQANRLIDDLKTVQASLANLTANTVAKRDDVKALQSDLKTLDEQRQRLEQLAEENEPGEGQKLRRVVGDGDRQYLTGLKVGGKRIVILLDASASMLDETIVNIVRRRNMSEARQRQAPKWRRALRTLDWIVAQIPKASRFQIYLFNERARPLIANSRGTWLDAGDAARVNEALDEARQVVPAKGTSLYHAFRALKDLSPKPDNVFLITDGLPTQGKTKPLGSKVTAVKRYQYFDEAVGVLPGRLPVNVILFPIEGDPEAPSAFWKLARASAGSLVSPASDWP
jgi:DNA-binding transcriptional regulator YbjK